MAHKDEVVLERNPIAGVKRNFQIDADLNETAWIDTNNCDFFLNWIETNEIRIIQNYSKLDRNMHCN